MIAGKNLGIMLYFQPQEVNSLHSLLYRFALSCVEKRIIDQQELDWLVYGLEKRITTIVTAMFFMLIGIHLANMLSVFAFMSSFYFLRVRTNGYHANSFIACLIFSLLLELLFLKLMLPALNVFVFLFLNTVSFFIIFFFAPFANCNMHLDEDEFRACRKTSRIRISVLSTISVLLHISGKFDVSKGITLGSTMTALLLVIAYIKKEGENEHEKREQSKQENPQVRSLSDYSSGNV